MSTNTNENKNINININNNDMKKISFKYGIIGGVSASLIANAIWYLVQYLL